MGRDWSNLFDNRKDPSKDSHKSLYDVEELILRKRRKAFNEEQEKSKNGES